MSDLVTWLIVTGSGLLTGVVIVTMIAVAAAAVIGTSAYVLLLLRWVDRP